MSLSRVIPGGWLDESGALSRVTPFGWVQESQSGTVAPSATFAITLDDVVFAGGAEGSTATTSAQFAIVLDDTVFAGGAVGDVSSGTITTQAFKNNTGTLLTSLAVAKVWAIPFADAADFTNVITNATSGVLAITDASITPGASYLLVSCNTDGSVVGVKKYTAS